MVFLRNLPSFARARRALTGLHHALERVEVCEHVLPRILAENLGHGGTHCAGRRYVKQFDDNFSTAAIRHRVETDRARVEDV